MVTLTVIDVTNRQHRNMVELTVIKRRFIYTAKKLINGEHSTVPLDLNEIVGTVFLVLDATILQADGGKCYFICYKHISGKVAISKVDSRQAEILKRTPELCYDPIDIKDLLSLLEFM